MFQTSPPSSLFLTAARKGSQLLRVHVIRLGRLSQSLITSSESFGCAKDCHVITCSGSKAWTSGEWRVRFSACCGCPPLSHVIEKELWVCPPLWVLHLLAFWSELAGYTGHWWADSSPGGEVCYFVLKRTINFFLFGESPYYLRTWPDPNKIFFSSLWTPTLKLGYRAMKG